MSDSSSSGWIEFVKRINAEVGTFNIIFITNIKFFFQHNI